MKVTEKKKKFQRDCREQVKAGKINNAGGQFVPAREINPQNSQVSMMQAGYRV